MSQQQAQVKITGITDTGLQRSANEDHIGFDEGLGIAVLADGMGGHKAGGTASRMAVDSVLENLKKLINQETSVPITSSQLLAMVSNTISDSNSEIYQASSVNSDFKGMGTTMVAAVIKGSQLVVGHVGDSRAYLFRNKFLSRITRDHSLLQELIDKGFYTELEARTATVGHVVTRALGTRAEVEVDAARHELEHHDLVLLCSDGLTDMVSDSLIEVVLQDAQDVESAAKTLVELANEHGGRDNISVILVQVQAGS
ncbi:MAG: Stp1/IreP family PP2C-type Ser/Thr phosphatase [Proteobacteria bacterium]|nr:Stp1/IreP family PP2C-type Ser/Thr phosphatase [Pseudomonadota bacterium]